MKQVLITGGAGFLGSHLAELLLKRGHRVTVLDDESSGSPENLLAVRDHFDFHYVRGAVEDRSRLRVLLRVADEVYHLAATVGVPRLANLPADLLRKNLSPLEALLDELLLAREEKHSVQLFLASSSEVYGLNPLSQWSEEYELVQRFPGQLRGAFGIEQALAESLVVATARQHGLAAIIGRLFPVVGPRQSLAQGMVLPAFVSSALAGKPPVVYDDGAQERTFGHVADVCRAMADLMDTANAVGQVFNIGSEEPVTILELAERVVASIDSKLDIEFESYRQTFPADFVDVKRAVPDLAKLKQTINYQPEYDLDAAIREVIDWQRSLLQSKGAGV